MTTSEFIKMLQEADPSGNAHVRMEGGIPIFAEPKEGYWDGPYSYIDEDGNYVYSSEGMKVDIHCRDVDGFVEYHFNLHEPDNWEKIKSKFKFKLTTYSKAEKEERMLDYAKKCYDESYEIHKKIYDENVERNVKNAEKGWTWFQNKEVDNKDLKPNMHRYYTWQIFNENGEKESSNPWNTEGVFRSGLFERLDNNKKEGYYQWVIKN